MSPAVEEYYKTSSPNAIEPKLRLPGQIEEPRLSGVGEREQEGVQFTGELPTRLASLSEWIVQFEWSGAPISSTDFVTEESLDEASAAWGWTSVGGESRSSRVPTPDREAVGVRLSARFAGRKRPTIRDESHEVLLD